MISKMHRTEYSGGRGGILLRLRQWTDATIVRMTVHRRRSQSPPLSRLGRVELLELLTRLVGMARLLKKCVAARHFLLEW